MKKISVLLCGIAMLLLSSVGAEAAVIKFDDVPGARQNIDDNPIPAGYEGFNWDNFYVMHQYHRLGTGYEYGVVSGEWTAFNGFGNPASITSSDEFLFTGAYFTSAWYPQTLYIQGFRDGIELFSADFTIDTDKPKPFSVDWNGIDRLVFKTSRWIHNENKGQFAMDNFTVNEPFTPVPAPAAILLLGSGLIALMTQTRSKNMFRDNAANS
jgi:hypothetical protein